LEKADIKGMAKAEVEEALSAMGEERYRARQIFRWLYKEGATSFDVMADLPSELRARLKLSFHITRLTPLDSRRSKADDTAKYLFKLEDGNSIETAFIPEGKRGTVCLSSQVGCKFSCTFCASAHSGFVRNLNVSEILEEVLAVRREDPKVGITNLVFMGIGEPLDNYDNVMKSARLFNEADAFNIGARRITISTCGIIPAIERLKSERVQFELSVSLHSADDATRSRLMPINKRYPLKELMVACRDYIEKTGRIITFEYVLISGLNASAEDARKLARLLKGLKCKVNTIAYNQIKAKALAAPSTKEIKLFLSALRSAGVNAIHRKSKGEDIDAGCGQLRISRI
jgi:23S rRNA (adenine2503-C2)-methyltransferase